jgi:predicted porin
MKRSLPAICLSALAAGAVHAQSSVTLFGAVDLGVRMVRNDQTTYQLAQDGMGSSRLGFRGVEDLGDGLKASFWLEGALGPDTGTGTSSFGNGDTTGPGAFMFRRRSTVSLANQWGELRLGRDYTPTFWNWSVFDPFSLNGVGGAGNLAINANLRALRGAGAAYGTLQRANNAVGYFLPNGAFGPGLYGQLMVAAGESAPANKYYGGRIGYAAGPFNVAAAYGRTDVDVSGSVTLDNWNVGGSWNFGIVKFSGVYSQLDLGGGPLDAQQRNWFIGIAAPLGQWNLKASYGQMSGGGQVEGNKANQWAVGADYNLSKRTALYATVSAVDNTNTAFSVSGTGSALTRGNNSSGAEIGMRHLF